MTNMKNIIKQIKYMFLFIIFIFALFLVSCYDKEIIDYDLEIIETTIEATEEFSFGKPNDDLEKKSNIMTKKMKDNMTNDAIKEAIKKRTRKKVAAKGIYLPAYVAGKPEKFDPIFENLKNSDLNCIVVDIKDELGRITIENNSKIVKELKTTEIQIKDIKSFIEKCHNENIYVVARIATFLDNFATRQDSSMAIKKKDGKLYKDNLGYYWLNPFVEKTREYIKEIAISAAETGFDEIQLDYFRFSTDGGMRKVDFTEEMTGGKTKIDVLTSLAQDIYMEMINRNVYFSLDVYGSIINSYKDQFNIGQNYPELIKYCDYICPMVYPSHYANTTFGIEVPDTEPYKTVLGAMQTSKNVVENALDPGSHYGEVRPWLQAFTANYLETYITYGKEEYEAQIKAVYESGYNEFLLWQGGGVYRWDELLQIDDLKKKQIETENSN